MADAFEGAWKHINPDERRGGVMMGREGFPEEEEVDDLAPQIDMGGDACCIDAKNKWEEACIEGFPENWDAMNYPYATEGEDYDNEIEHNPDGLAGGYYQSILDKYRNMSCEEFKEHLESRLGDISMGSLEGQLAMAAHRILQEWDECIQQSMGLGSDEAMDMYRSEDRHSHTPFDSAWDIFRARDYNHQGGGDSVVKQEDRFANIEHFAGVSAVDELFNPKHKLLGRAGMSASPRERGHEHHSFDWGLDEKGKKDAGFDFDNPNYHIDDIMEGSAQQAAARMLAPVDAECVNPTFGAPCKAFSISGEPVGWKPNRDAMEMVWEIVHGNKDFPTLTERDTVHQTEEGKALQNDKIKRYLNKIRGREGGWGFPVYEPRTIDELMFHEDSARPDLRGMERVYSGRVLDEDRAKAIRGRKEGGLATLQRAVDIMREFERKKRMGFGFIENPMGQMRYNSAISHLPHTKITQGSFREPAQTDYMGLPRNDAYFEQGEYMRATNPKLSVLNEKGVALPPLKPTDLFGPLPPTMFVRPDLPKSELGRTYAPGTRGSQNALQGMKGLSADALFPGSPVISPYHMKSSLPAYLGDDFTQAVEQYFDIEAPNEEFRGTNVNDILRRKFAPKQATLNDWHGVDLSNIERFSRRE